MSHGPPRLQPLPIGRARAPRARVFALLVLLSATGQAACRNRACPPPAPPPRPVAATPPLPQARPAMPSEARPAWRRTELFFGLTRRDGSPVTEEAWVAFVEETVSPEFPEGSTVMHADGRYRDSDGVLHREPSRVLVVFYPVDRARTVDAAVARITQRWLDSFDQESVLRSDTDARVTFVGRDAPAPPPPPRLPAPAAR